MNDILDLRIGLTIGLLNEKNNQMIDLKIKNNEEENDKDKVIIGDGNMLKNM